MMNKLVWITLLVGLMACGSSSSVEEDTTSSDAAAPSDTVDDTRDPRPPSDATGPSDGVVIVPPDVSPETMTPPNDGSGFPFDQCWSPAEVVSTMDCEAICANILQCDPDDECELMCPIVGKYLSESVGTELTQCLTKPCSEFEGDDYFSSCAQGIVAAATLPGVAEGKDVCDAGMNALVSCPTVDSQVPPMFHMGCMMAVPLFSEEAQAKIAACAKDPCSFLDCVSDANCFLGQMLDEMPDDGGGPPPGPGPGPPDMCWMPDMPEEGYNMDCSAFCAKAVSCTDIPPMECEMYCFSNAAYINKTAGPLVDECVAAGECSKEMGTAILPLCLVEVAGKSSGGSPTSSEGEAICGKLLLAIGGCPNMDEFVPLFKEACTHLATLVTFESMEQLAPCGDLKCDATMQCVMENNCMIMSLLTASMMVPPKP